MKAMRILLWEMVKVRKSNTLVMPIYKHNLIFYILKNFTRTIPCWLSIYFLLKSFTRTITIGIYVMNLSFLCRARQHGWFYIIERVAIMNYLRFLSISFQHWWIQVLFLLPFGNMRWKHLCGIRLRHPPNNILGTMLRNSRVACNTDEHVKVYSHRISGKNEHITFHKKVWYSWYSFLQDP